MRKKEDKEIEIRKGFNCYGGMWLDIFVSKDLKTEIAFFVRIGEFLVSDLLTEPEIELFRGTQTSYLPK